MALKRDNIHQQHVLSFTIHIRERGLSRIEANAFVCVRSFVCVCACITYVVRTHVCMHTL